MKITVKELCAKILPAMPVRLATEVVDTGEVITLDDVAGKLATLDDCIGTADVQDFTVLPELVYIVI